MEDQFNAGTATRLDVDQARVQLARVQQALIAARNDRENARVALLDAIGADESSSDLRGVDVGEGNDRQRADRGGRRAGRVTHQWSGAFGEHAMNAPVGSSAEVTVFTK
jgi:hypothetical protein